ncbi:MAG: TIGR00730 family Rossman fold protein [bacterium]|nr:TIGR00730 family Rossman fold protein [bacterium]
MKKTRTVKKNATLEDEAIKRGVGEVYTDYRDTWRVFKIMAELVEGYNFLSSLKNEITIFGSARLDPKNKYCVEAEKLAGLLARKGFTIITGGGPGIMEAANKGAFEAGGESVGLNIQLPFEQRINPYVKKSTAFHYFFTRKVMLASPSNAFVFFPGGYGTMDEFFEVVDLMDQGVMTKAPVVLVGKEFWQPLIDFLKGSCCRIGSITEGKILEWHLVDTAEEAFAFIKDVKEEIDICDISPNNFHCEGNIDWKIFRVMAELVEGFEFVTGLEKAVTILGTKSIGIESPYYNAAYSLGQKLAEKKYSVVTGGKFGTAEAANKGAFEAGGMSYGIGLKIGKRVEVNHYLNQSILFDFPFIRKLIVTAPTKALVFFPGGLGSMHHLFEVMTLMQTGKIPKIPLVLYDKKFWGKLFDFIDHMLVTKFETIIKKDERLLKVVDSIDEIIAEIEG